VLGLATLFPNGGVAILLRKTLLLFAVLALVPAASPRAAEAGRDARGLNGAVTSGHPLATEAGLDVLRAGGNAMDAAITMAGVLAVARPHMNGVGGDMFLLYYDAGAGEIHGLNASGRAGSARTLEDLRAGGLTRMPGYGALSVSVPGVVGGWAAALERFGTLSWSEALRPAADLARGGLPVSEKLARDIGAYAAKLEQEREAAAIYLPGGAAPRPGAILMQSDLADTLDLLRTHGPDEFYTGETGRSIADYLQTRGGHVTADDMAAYAPQWVQPISAPYRGVDVVTLPPSTQGVTMLQQLLTLALFDLAAMGRNTPAYIHTMSQAIARSFADMDAHVADPDYMRLTVEELLAPERIAGFVREIEADPRADFASDIPDHPNTVYLIAVDDEGNVVSMIQSLFDSFGSGLVVPGTGIVLQNRAALFRLDPQSPNAFGPGRLPFHTLMPVIALQDGAPILAFGTPGGFAQTQVNVQVLNNILLFGMTPQQAVDAPRFVRMRNGSLQLETAIGGETAAALGTAGYDARLRPPSDLFGGAQAILIDPVTGALHAGADRRREGFALAW